MCDTLVALPSVTQDRNHSGQELRSGAGRSTSIASGSASKEYRGKTEVYEVVKDIGGGCGEESLRVVNMMNSMPQKWTPGKQRGVAVRVQYNLPVKFKLEN